MSGDKLKRVRAIRKWLEMAEDSYQSHEDLNGEIHLLFARAEMERLKETHRESKILKWLLRAGAFLSAALLLGICWLGKIYFFSPEEGYFGTSVVQEFPEGEKVTEDTAVASKGDLSGKKETESVSESTNAENVSKGTVKETETQGDSDSDYQPVQAAYPENYPELSEQKIQMVVGEASRTLRGRP